jgi:transcriptional regulator with XRE-family HTH domain
MNDLGAKIRKERRDKGMTLRYMAKQTNLSISFLSQLERGLTNPSVSSIKKIAHVLGSSVVNFFADGQNGNNGNFAYPPSKPDETQSRYVQNIKVLRADERKCIRLPKSHILYELLTPDLKRQIEAMFMRIYPGDTSGDESVCDPSGEKLAIVLKGNIEFNIGEEVHRLKAGDTIYFPAHLPQRWRGLGKGQIEVIWVLTPPCF